MKSTRAYIGIWLPILMTLMLVFTGCSSKSDDTGKDVPIIEKQAVSISITVIDTQESPLDEVNLTFSGDVVDVVNESVSNISTVQGIALVYADAKENNIVRILAKKDGYLDTGAEVDASASGEYSVIIKMINIDNETLAGVDPVQESIPNAVDENGTTTKPLEVNATNARISIPEGSTLTTADGEVVTGDVTVTVTSFEAGATEAFPGGLNVVAAGVPNADGDTSVNMISAGFVSIVVEDEDGDRVKNGTFDITINVTNATNPETGNPVIAGDIIPLWSYDETTGKWTFESNGTVVDNNGVLEVTGTTTHLSYYNLDYWQSDRCTQRINIIGGEGLITEWNFSMPGWSHGAIDYAADGRLDLLRAPANRDLTTEISYAGQVIYEDELRFVLNQDGSCDPIDVNITGLTPEVVDTTIAFTESCPDGSKLSPIPNVYLYQYPPYAYYGVTNSTGKKTIALADGSSINLRYYLYLGSNRDRYVGWNYYVYSSTTFVSGTDKTVNFTLEEEFCPTPVVTGTGGTGGF